MNFNQFLLVLKARRWVILATLLITVATTVVISLMLPKNYAASATLVIDTKGFDPITGMTLPFQLTPNYIATQVGIISSPTVALRVVKGLGLDKIPALQQQFQESEHGKGDLDTYIANLLLKKLSVDPSRTSNLVGLSFEGGDPQFAAVVANAFAKAYIETNLDLKTQPAQQSSAWYDQQIEQLRQRLSKAQNILSQYQQQHGLVSDQSLDLETAHLADLSNQLVAAQASSIQASSRQKERAELPDVISNPVVQALTPQLVQLDVQLADMEKTVGPNNPKYLSTLAQRNTVKKQLDNARAQAEQSITATAQAGQSQLASLQAAFAAQKAKVLEIQQERDQASILKQDVTNAKQAYDSAMQRLSQTSLEAKSVQTDVEILSPAVPPTTPSSPKVILNTLAAIFLGSLLGVGFAFLLEILDRPVRSAQDIQLMLDIPVLNATFGKPRALPGARRFLLPFRSQSA